MKRTPILSLDRFDPSREHAFYVNHFAAHLRDFHADIDHPHRHDFYLLVIISRGTGFHDIDFRRHTVQPGTIFLLQPGQTHYWEFSDDIDGLILFHTASFFHLHFPEFQLSRLPFFRSRQQNPYLLVEESDSSKLLEKMNELLAEYMADLSYRSERLAALLSLLYIDLARLYVLRSELSVDDDSRYATILHLFESAIESNFREEHAPAFYADKLRISGRHLNRICQNLLGKTSSQVIAERVILEARKKLSAGEKHLGIIAADLGFEEYSYFSRFFKAHTGERPKTFKTTRKISSAGR